MRSNRLLMIMLLVLVHSFISCDGAAYHLQEDVEHVSNALSQNTITADNDQGQSDNQPPVEIHAHQHCHCGYYSTLSHAIIPQQSKPSVLVYYHGLNYPPDVPPPNSFS